MPDDMEFEVVLPRRVLKQPRPPIRGEGDCAACAFGGILGWKDVEEVYDRAGDVANRFEMWSALSGLRGEGEVDAFLADTPLWVPVMHSLGMPWGLASWDVPLQWFAYVRMGLEAGYYALTSVIHDRRGPVDLEKGRLYYGKTDHAVMIVGARAYWVEGHVKKSRRQITEVLVSCSARSSPDLEWVDVHEFLAERGGYGVVMIRPGGSDDDGS